MDVLDQFPRVGVLINQVRFETALEPVPASPMPPVKPDIVRGLQPPHRGAEIGAGCLQQQVIVVGDEAVRAMRQYAWTTTPNRVNASSTVF